MRTLVFFGLIGTGILQACSSDSGAVPPQTESTTSPTYRLTDVDVDHDYDGTINQRFTLLYDEQGLSVGELIDSNADGNPDSSFTYQYQNSRLAGSRYDSSNDGQVNAIRTFTYNTAGLPASVLIDDGNDGSADRRIDYRLADSGLLTAAEADNDGDGLADITYRYGHDTNGRLLTITAVSVSNGEIISTERIDYDSVGRALTKEIDLNNDGIMNERWVYRYQPAPCVDASNHAPVFYQCVGG